jgi:hypothetical protein
MRTLVMLVLTVAIVSTQALAQVDVLTQHNDNQRSGLNTHETVLNQQDVKNNFGKLWTLDSDAKIMAQPLYVSNLKSPKCPAGCNTVIFASMKGTIYAYLADQKPASQNDTLVWARYLGDPENGSGAFDMWATDDPWWGILGTPVIDRSSNSIYAVVWNSDGRYRLYNVALDSGAIKQGPVVIAGSVGRAVFDRTGEAGWQQVRKQRAALLLSNGMLYVAFGGDNPTGLAGWLFVYDASTLAFKTVWSPTPDGTNGGIWQSGQGPAADAAGNVYLLTGDGDFDAGSGRYADSMVRLRLGAGGLSVADYFAPCDQSWLRTSCDLDLGSSGPLLFDDMILGGGKTGELYLMKAAKLAHFQAGIHPPPAGPNCMAIPACTDGPLLTQRWKAANGHIHGSPIIWNGPGGKRWIYVMGEGSHLNAYPYANGKANPNGVRQSAWVPPAPGNQPCGGPVMNWMPGGIMSVSSNGNNAGTGIVWVLVPTNGDANSYRGVKGALLALDAEDVSKALWRSQGTDGAISDTPDSFGLLARFAPPTIANGKVFVGTAGDKEQLYRWCGHRPAWNQFPANYYLAVYGLKN